MAFLLLALTLGSCPSPLADLERDLDAFREAWPARFRADFGENVPTVAPRLATGAPPAPTGAPTDQPETAAQPATTAPVAVPPQATSLAPASAFAGVGKGLW